MNINGSIFRRERKKIYALCPAKGHRGKPTAGTQQWLADEAKVSLRSVQNLEKGKASLKTLEAVSNVLGIVGWKEFITNYGAEYVTCSANKYIDFRPEAYPKKHPDSFMHSIMIMTIDPLSIVADSGKFDSFSLQEVRAKLVGLDQTIPFSWYAEASLTPDMKNWLGKKQEIDQLNIEADDEISNVTIIFNQDNIRVSWLDFIQMIEGSSKSQFDVELELEFTQFTKKFKIHVSIDLLKILFQQGRQKYQSEHPYRVQLRTILSN